MRERRHDLRMRALGLAMLGILLWAPWYERRLWGFDNYPEPESAAQLWQTQVTRLLDVGLAAPMEALDPERRTNVERELLVLLWTALFLAAAGFALAPRARLRSLRFVSGLAGTASLVTLALLGEACPEAFWGARVSECHTTLLELPFAFVPCVVAATLVVGRFACPDTWAPRIAFVGALLAVIVCIASFRGSPSWWMGWAPFVLSVLFPLALALECARLSRVQTLDAATTSP